MGCALCRRRKPVVHVQPTLEQLTEQMIPKVTNLGWQKSTSSRNPLQDFASNPLLAPPLSESSVASPCLLEIDRHLHLWVAISMGIIHLVSSDGLSDWQVVELTVEASGASRPHACLNEPENSVYLFFEQADQSSKSSKVKVMSACVPSAEFSHGDWLWSSAVELLRPELEWEKVQAPRVGNPFVVYNTFRDQWLLYYSASVCRCDAMRFALFMGVAASSSLEGPYERLQGKPLLGPDGPQTVGSGSFKMIKGFDKLSYDQEAATGRRLLALESRMTRRDGAMASCIALLSSADGFAWSLVDGAFLAPKKKKHVHSFDTVIPSFDPDHVFIYYDARDAEKHWKESVGVARVPVSFLESIAETTATRVQT